MRHCTARRAWSREGEGGGGGISGGKSTPKRRMERWSECKYEV